MEFEEFLTKVILIVHTHDDLEHRYGYKVAANPKVEEFIKSETWVTGGGSCWKEDGHYSLDSEPEAEFDDLDKVLQEVAPSCSFLQYKLISKHIKRQIGSDNEYYGNYTDWSFKFMFLIDLFNTLKELKLI